jgi:hypothetical protein
MRYNTPPPAGMLAGSVFRGDCPGRNRRLGLLSPRRAHVNAPYKTDLLWKTLRALTAVTGRAARTVFRGDAEFTRARTPGRCASAAREDEALT